MREHNPSWKTMGAVLFEDENPQLTAKLIVDFEDEDEFVEIPVGIGQPEFLTTESWCGEVEKRIIWHTKNYVPDRPCRIVALRLDFIEYGDYAVRALGDAGSGQSLGWTYPEEGDRVMQGIVTSYSIYSGLDSERQLC